MQNTQIGNPKTPAAQSSGTTMSDMDRITDILSTEKYLTDGFNIAVREASHDSLHQAILTCLTETHQCARNIYNVMFQQGMYTLEAAQQPKLDQAYQKFNSYLSQIPYSGQMQ